MQFGNDLHRPPDGVQDSLEPLRVVEDEFRPLVAGEAPREPNRQRVGVEQRAGRDHPRGADVLLVPAVPRPLADECEQVITQRLARFPERLVRNRSSRIGSPA